MEERLRGYDLVKKPEIAFFFEFEDLAEFIYKSFYNIFFILPLEALRPLNFGVLAWKVF